ncbi:hypothetical protein SDJN03_18692, partial [Cucurbita argyrosperma subsp. sororia]
MQAVGLGVVRGRVWAEKIPNGWGAYAEVVGEVPYHLLSFIYRGSSPEIYSSSSTKSPLIKASNEIGSVSYLKGRESPVASYRTGIRDSTITACRLVSSRS